MKKYTFLKYLFFVAFLLLASVNFLFAQQRCGTNQLETLHHTKKPELLNLKIAMEDTIQTLIKQRRELGDTLKEEIITIPIVFHVLYSNESENVEKEKLTSQVDVLNFDFRRKNDDKNDKWPQAADTRIRFCLSNIDIDGNYFNGITRTKTGIEYFEYGKDSIFLTKKGGKDIWPGYLNIYVCDLGLYNGLNIGAYASLPYYDAYTDGIVLDYRVTGLFGEFIWPYFGGRTATHEVGHWLNLEHLWGPTESFSCYEQDDGVGDTPFSKEPYYGCYEGNSCESEDMVENFMEYRDDYCLNLFTKGQTERMRTSIEIFHSRNYLLDENCLRNCTRIDMRYLLSEEKENATAIDTVYASNSIEKNAEATYIAGKVVILDNDFSVDTSSTFLADIKFSEEIDSLQLCEQVDSLELDEQIDFLQLKNAINNRNIKSVFQN